MSEAPETCLSIFILVRGKQIRAPPMKEIVILYLFRGVYTGSLSNMGVFG